jgi:hypothetical protein
MYLLRGGIPFGSDRTRNHQGVFVYSRLPLKAKTHPIPDGPIRKNLIAAKCNCFQRIAFGKYF